MNTNIIDALNRNLFASSKIISEPVIEQVTKVLNLGKIVFIGTNQKGSYSCFVCEKCGKIPKCQRCDRNFYLNQQNFFVCPVCGKKEKPKEICDKCQGNMITSIGWGIIKIKNEIEKLFFDQKIIFIDQTISQRKAEELEREIMQINSGIIVCDLNFFRIAKYNRNVGLLVFLNTDKTFFLPDYNAFEQKFLEIGQFLSDEWEVMIQTRLGDSEIIEWAMSGNYEKLFDSEIKLRKDVGLPPFLELIKFSVKEVEEKKAIDKLNELKIKIQEVFKNEFELLMDPFPAYNKKIRDKFVYHLILGFKKGEREKKGKLMQEKLIILATECLKKKINLDVDPVGLI